MTDNPADNDPIVAEVRQIREQLFARFNYDLHALVKEMQRRTEADERAGRKVISLPPRRPQGWTDPAKKAG